jgi:hypothetical protein
MDSNKQSVKGKVSFCVVEAFFTLLTGCAELLESLFEELVHVSNTERLAHLAEIFRQATVLEINFWESKLAFSAFIAKNL